MKTEGLRNLVRGAAVSGLLLIGGVTACSNEAPHISSLKIHVNDPGTAFTTIVADPNKVTARCRVQSGPVQIGTEDSVCVLIQNNLGVNAQISGIDTQALISSLDAINARNRVQVLISYGNGDSINISGKKDNLGTVVEVRVPKNSDTKGVQMAMSLALIYANDVVQGVDPETLENNLKYMQDRFEYRETSGQTPVFFNVLPIKTSMHNRSKLEEKKVRRPDHLRAENLKATKRTRSRSQFRV